MPVPCYGCGDTVRVDRRWPERGLVLAGWALHGGETYCWGCARERGFTSESSAEVAAEQPPEGIAIADPATNDAAARYLGSALTAALVGGVGMAGVLLALTFRVTRDNRPLMFGAVSALLLLAGGLAAAHRVRRWRVLLAGSAWRAYRLTFVPVCRRRPGLLLAPEDQSAPPLVLRLGAVFKWRSALLRTATGRTVWVGGDPNSQAVLAVHPGPRLFPAAPVPARSLPRYQASVAGLRSAEPLSADVRQSVIEKAHDRSELAVVVTWGVLGLATISRPTTLAWLVAGLETLMWGAVLVRLRLVRDRQIEAATTERQT